MAMKTSFPKQDIKVLLLEGVSRSAVEAFQRAGYSQIEFHEKALPEADLKARIEQGIARGGTVIAQQDQRRRGWLRRGVETLSFFLLRLGVALTGKADSF